MRDWKRYVSVAAKLVHFVLALSLLSVAIAEYVASPPVFDVVGRYRDRHALPDGLFQVCFTALIVSRATARVREL